MSEIERNEKGQFVPGHSGGPGRPKGISIKEEIKKYLAEHPDDFEQLIKYYLTDKKMRDLLWRMIDGNPQTSTDITSGGKPIPILSNALPSNNSDQENIQPLEEDSGDSGGNVGL